MMSIHEALEQEPHIFFTNKWHGENRLERAGDGPPVYLGSSPKSENTRTLTDISGHLVPHLSKVGNWRDKRLPKCSLQNTSPKSLFEKKGTVVKQIWEMVTIYSSKFCYK